MSSTFNLVRNSEIILVFKLEEFSFEQNPNLKSKDLYQITFIKKNENTNSDLLFINPGSSDTPGKGLKGFICLFSRSFFTKVITDKLDTLQMDEGKLAYYSLSEKQDLQLSMIFINMQNEINSQYTYKDDLLRNYISEITHIAVKSLCRK